MWITEKKKIFISTSNIDTVFSSQVKEIECLFPFFGVFG